MINLKFDGLNIEIKNIKSFIYIDENIVEKTKEEMYGILKFDNNIIKDDEILLNSLDSSFIYFYLDESKKLYFTKNLKYLGKAVSLKEDMASKYMMLELGYVIPPYTMFEDVYRLFPYSSLKIIKENNSYSFSLITKAWNFKEKSNLSYNEAIDKFENILKENLKKETNTKKENIFTLSGGVDSCLLLKLSEEYVDIKKDKTLTTVSPGQDKELNRSKFLSKQCRLEHKLFNSDKKELFKISEKYNKKYCEPVYDLMSPVEYAMINSLKQKQLNVIEGQAADSLFLGLPHNQAFNLYKKYKKINFLFNGLSILLKGKSFNKGSRSGKFLYRLKKISNILLAKSEKEFLINLIGIEKTYTLENKLYVERIEKTLNALTSINKSMHYTIAYYFMYRILPVREMQKYRMLKDEGIKFSLPYIEGNMIEFFLSIPEEFWIDDRRRKKIVFDLGKKIMPEIDFGDKTTPFYVETFIDLKKLSDENKKIYEKYINKVFDKELFIKSLVEYDSFKKIKKRS